MSYKSLIFFILGYLPFYLPLRFTIPFNITFIPDIIISILFYCVLIQKNVLNKTHNRIDIMMTFFFLYSLTLVFMFSTFRGGLITTLDHIHTFISGIIMFFAVRHLLEKKDFEFILNIFKYTGIIVSIAYISVWINVNLLGGSFPSWVIKYFNEFGTGSQFLWKGYVGFYRPMGMIGYSHSTGIFLSGALAIVYTYYQENLNKSKFIIIMLFISIIMTASRTAILSVFLIFLFDWSNVGLFQKLKKYLKLLIVCILFLFVYFSYFETKEITFLFTLLSNSFSSSGDINYSIFDSFIGMFNVDIQQFSRIINNYPLALLVGAGFPIYSSELNLNPILTNDTYFLQWITQYGLVGSLLMFVILIHVFRSLSRFLKLNNINSNERVVAISTYRVLLIYLFSTIHSSSIQAYPIYFSFFTFLGIASYLNSKDYVNKKLNLLK